MLLSRLGASWARLGGVLGPPWEHLGQSWEHLRASCARLAASCGFSAEKRLKTIDFMSEYRTPKPLKIKPPLQREHDLRDFEIFENSGPFASILVQTWLHFGSIFQVLGRLGGILGRLGGVLGAKTSQDESYAKKY